MLLLASILSGLKSFSEITDLTVAKCEGLTQEESRLFYDPETSEAVVKKIMLKTNRQFTECYGLRERSTVNAYLSEDSSAPKVQVFGIEDQDGFMFHYGLLFRSKEGNYVMHIDSSTETVKFEKAEDVFEIRRRDPLFKSIYTFMLPWHEG